MQALLSKASCARPVAPSPRAVSSGYFCHRQTDIHCYTQACCSPSLQRCDIPEHGAISPQETSARAEPCGTSHLGGRSTSHPASALGCLRGAPVQPRSASPVISQGPPLPSVYISTRLTHMREDHDQQLCCSGKIDCL